MKLCVDWAFENKGGKAKNSKKIKQELVLINIPSNQYSL